MSCARHVLVVGAGIIGVNVALALLGRGFAVTLIDEREPGTATSRGNAACIATAEITPISMPGLIWQVPGMLVDPLGPLAIRWSYLPRLTPWLWKFWRAGTYERVEAITHALATLVGRAWDDWVPVLEQARLVGCVTRKGGLFVYESDAGFRAATHEWELRARHGVRLEHLDGAAIAELEPALAPIFRHGYLVPDWGHVADPYAITAGLADHAVRLGATIKRQRVTGFDFADGRPAAAALDGDLREPFDVVVIAAGAWSRPLIRQLGSDAPLDTERGYNTTLPEPRVRLTRAVSFGERSFVATPLSIGLRIGGAVELAGLEAPPNYARSKALLALGRRALPGLNVEGGSEWMGFRPSMPDSLPVISASPRHANVFFAFGHGHLGLTEAATTGTLIAELAAGIPTAIDVAPFRIDRF